jgi:hypothetical protein
VSNTSVETPVYLSSLPILSPRMRALVVEGDVEGTYSIKAKKWRDKSFKDTHGHSVTTAIATAAARTGWKFQQLRDVLLDSPAKGGNHARNKAYRRGYDKAVDYLARVWEHAQKVVSESSIASRQDSFADLIRLRDRIGSLAWRGTASSTALRLLMACWHAAYRSGGRRFSLSYREAAELAGCTLATAYKVINRRLRGWLRLLETGEGESGSTWYLLDGSRSAEQAGDLDAGVIGRLMGLDAFAHRGLGSSSLKVIAALHVEDGQDAADLAVNASMSRATVYRHAGLLVGFGLVTKVDGAWHLTETALEALSGDWDGWDKAAAELGTLGVTGRRRALHRAQRAAWLDRVLPRLRQRRAPDVEPVRGDEAPPDLVQGNLVIDPVTGEVLDDFVVASDGRLLFVQDEPDYDELCRLAALACAA